MMQNTKAHYARANGKAGRYAQRRWPNEEFCRFMGRNFFSKPESERKDIRILEAGCGTGANLRLLVQEGFGTYGIDLSEEAVSLSSKLWGAYGCEIVCGNMMELPWKDNSFHAVADVFSSYCLAEEEFQVFSDEVYRVLEKGGIYFSYTPSKGSEAFLNYEPAQKIDASTLDGIRRESSPYYGNFYPFRFMNMEDIEKFFDKKRFDVRYMEKVSRTYRTMEETFEFLVFEAVKR